MTLPIPENLGKAYLTANWAWRDRTTFADNLQTDPGAVIPGYGLLNVRADWKDIAGYPIDIGFFMKSALNKLFITGGTSAQASVGFGWVSYGEPRMFGVQMRYNFGPHATSQ